MRFIQVGVGGFGRNWVKALKAEPRAKVVGLVDPNPAALAEACAAGGYDRGICFATLDEALARAKAEAVVCVTPPRLHRQILEQAMHAGLHTITEKPLADELADCQAICAAARKTKRVCAVSQNYRYAPATWTLAKLIREGAIGRIGQVTVEFFKGVDFGGGFRHEMPYPVLIDMSIHHFDLLRFITGLDAIRAWGQAWNPFWSNYRGDCSSSVVFELTGGVRAVYNASWCAKGDFCDWNGNWRIEGERGTLVYQLGKITLHRVPELYKVASTEEVTPVEPPRPGQAQVLDDFLAAIAEGRQPATSCFDNLGSVGMVFAAVAAVSSGQPAVVAGREG